MDSPEPSDKVTLSYASPMGSAELLAQAEAMILANAPLTQIRDLFKKTKAAAGFYAAFQARRFAAANVDGVCKGCGQPTGDIVVALWLNSISLCTSCQARARRCLWTSPRQIAIGVAIALLGPAILVWSAFDPRWAVELRQELGQFFVVPPLLLLLAPIMVIAVREQRRYNRLPESLRKIIPDAVIPEIRPFHIPVADTMKEAPKG